MLTLSHTVDVHAEAAVHKVELGRTPQRLLVSAMLAGMWIGVGDVLMWSAGGAFHVAGDPATKLVAGSVFSAALTIVGGGVVIGLAYAFVAGRANARSTEDVSV